MLEYLVRVVIVVVGGGGGGKKSLLDAYITTAFVCARYVVCRTL